MVPPPHARMPDRTRTVAPARHEYPVIDDLGLVSARHADRLLAAARERGNVRWTAYLDPLPDRLRDDDLRVFAPLLCVPGQPTAPSSIRDACRGT